MAKRNSHLHLLHSIDVFRNLICDIFEQSTADQQRAAERMEQGDKPVEKRISESYTRRRQEINGKTEKEGKAHHAAAVENDVSINEDNIFVVYTHAASLVCASTPTC